MPNGTGTGRAARRRSDRRARSVVHGDRGTQRDALLHRAHTNTHNTNATRGVAVRPRHRSQQPDIDRKATEPGANSTRRSRSARLPQRRQRRARQRLALQEVARCPCRPSCSRRGTCTGHAKYPNPGLQTDRTAVGRIGSGWISRRSRHGARLPTSEGRSRCRNGGRSRSRRGLHPGSKSCALRVSRARPARVGPAGAISGTLSAATM